MSNLFKRIMLICTVIPFLLTVVFLLPYFNYLAIWIVALAFSVPGTYETWKLFYGGYTKADYAAVTIIAYSIPVTVYLENSGFLKINSVYYLIGFLAFLIFCYQVFIRDEKQFTDINKKTSTLLLLLFYPGLFFSYAMRFPTLPYPSYTMIAFMITVFLNDIVAYITGMMWGKKNRNIVPISPKKSAAGFAGGFSASVAASLFFYLIKPDFFRGNIKYAVFTGIAIGITAIIGDLSESAMKRSARTKDSGDVLPGRGGILDNIDSLILSAPVFYYILNYINLKG